MKESAKFPQYQALRIFYGGSLNGFQNCTY